ncbi:hypothetical protein B0H19DRAFT_1272369 [Mycena capillaripes]|nr:hypothetical protein B0H19DRAFT_1272369 [Mycena capillaripes]
MHGRIPLPPPPRARKRIDSWPGRDPRHVAQKRKQYKMRYAGASVGCTPYLGEDIAYRAVRATSARPVDAESKRMRRATQGSSRDTPGSSGAYEVLTHAQPDDASAHHSKDALPR